MLPVYSWYLQWLFFPLDTNKNQWIVWSLGYTFMIRTNRHWSSSPRWSGSPFCRWSPWSPGQSSSEWSVFLWTTVRPVSEQTTQWLSRVALTHGVSPTQTHTHHMHTPAGSAASSSGWWNHWFWEAAGHGRTRWCHGTAEHRPTDCQRCNAECGNCNTSGEKCLHCHLHLNNFINP